MNFVISFMLLANRVTENNIFMLLRMEYLTEETYIYKSKVFDIAQLKY